jgi:hypothetical protein
VRVPIRPAIEPLINLRTTSLDGGRVGVCVGVAARDARSLLREGRARRPRSGSPGALLRLGPLRTGRAAFTAPGSSKLSGCRWPGGLRHREDPSALLPYAVLHWLRASSPGRFTASAAASNLPGSSGVLPWRLFTSSPGPRQHPFEFRQMPVSGQLSRERPAGEPAINIPVSCCLSATGIRFLGHPSPLGDRPPSRSAHRPRSNPCDRNPTGFPRSTRLRYDRGGCPLYPEANGVSRPESRPRISGAASQRHALHPHHHSHRRARLNEASTGVHSRSPVRSSPSPVAPGWAGRPWA